MKEKMIVHRVPEYGDRGMGVRYFRNVTAATKFAKEQCKRLGHKGFYVESLPFEAVEELFREYVPVPGHFTRTGEPE